MNMTIKDVICFQKRDLIVSQVLILIVLLFLLCHSLKIFLNLYELSLACRGEHRILKSLGLYYIIYYSSGKELKEQLNESEVFRLLSIFSNMLIVFNSSVNFIIYFAKDPK